MIALATTSGVQRQSAVPVKMSGTLPPPGRRQRVQRFGTHLPRTVRIKYTLNVRWLTSANFAIRELHEAWGPSTYPEPTAGAAQPQP